MRASFKLNTSFCLILLLSFVGAASTRAQEAQNLSPETLEAFSKSPTWRNLYQYQIDFWGHLSSDVLISEFFFSPQGRYDPLAELQAAINAYKNPDTVWGQMRIPAACAFPARKKRIEDALGLKFANPSCPSLTEWLSNLKGDHLSLVFAGPYTGNPASIMGHTFLRISDLKSEAINSESRYLLSYSVGFLALTNPDDNRLTYMWKGLTGQYLGHFGVEPHYVKVGLYNNSESRDIWDHPLSFSPEQVQFFKLHLWEVIFNSAIPYYFVDENCSYRLLSLLEAIDPSLQLTSKLGVVVLPADTIRLAIDQKTATHESIFYASIKRKLHQRLIKLSQQEHKQFQDALKSKEELEKIENPMVLDALIDQWTFKNYKAADKLSISEKELMDETFQRRASINVKSPYFLSNQELREIDQVHAPYEGHKSSWVEASGGWVDEDASLSLGFRSGAHKLSLPNYGYEDSAQLEYLGITLTHIDRQDKPWIWRGVFVDVKSFNNFNLEETNWSWGLGAGASNDCQLCQTEQTSVYFHANGGIASKSKNFNLYLLPGFELRSWVYNGLKGMASPNVILGFRLEFTPVILNSYILQSWAYDFKLTQIASELTWSLSKNHHLILKTEALSGVQNSRAYNLAAAINY